MARNGWYNDSWRHSLAAKGIKTSKYNRNRNYFQSKTAQFLDIRNTPMTQDFDPGELVDVGRESAKDRISGKNLAKGELELKRRRASIDTESKEARPVNRLLKDVESNRFGEAISAIENPSILNEPDAIETRRAVQALKTAISARAFSLAGSGLPVPQAIEDQLDPDVIADLRNVQAAAKQQDTEGPLSKLFREVAPGAVGSALETPAVGLNFLAEGQNEELQQNLLNNIDNERPRRPGHIDGDLKDNPFVTSNAFIGNEEQSTAALKPLPDTIPKLRDNFNFVEGGPASNPVFSDSTTRETPADIVDKQIGELHSARNKLAEVDLSPFEKGNKAFERGDRESLIKSINELQREERKIKDRFSLVNAAGQNVTSRNNLDSAFGKKGGNFVVDLLGNGGDRIADQTKKLNEVREMLLDSNNKAFARRRMLELRLRRLDSSVPPETDVPVKVTRFSEGKKSFAFEDVNNPVFGDTK